MRPKHVELEARKNILTALKCSVILNFAFSTIATRESFQLFHSRYRNRTTSATLPDKFSYMRTIGAGESHISVPEGR